MRRYAFEAFIVHLLWSLFLFSFTDGFTLPFTVWLERFFQWDAKWYGSMALDGHGFMPHTYVFPPAHGWILGRLTDVAVFLAGFVQTKPIWSEYFFRIAPIFGISCFATGNTILVWLIERRWQIARPRLWMIAISNPVGYFAFTAYSDMLFFALFMATVALALWTSPRREIWGLPPLSIQGERLARINLVLLIALAPWVRLTGGAFAAWIFLKRKEALAAVISVAGFIGYNWFKTGDPFFFLLGQQAFMMPDGGLLKGLETSLRILGAFFDGTAYLGGELFLYAFNFGILTLTALGLSIGLVGWLWRQKEYELACLIFAIVLVSHNQAFWRSTVRYALPMYSLFLCMLWANPALNRPTLIRQITSGIFIALALTIQVFYARLFHAGAWAF